MNKSVSIICIGLLTLGACKGTDKVSSGGKQKTKVVACSNVPIDLGKPHVDWYEEDKSVLDSADEMLVLPKEYKIYSISNKQLDDFYTSINSGEQLTMVVPLAGDAGCQTFTMHKDSITSAQVKKMYPNTQMLKGISGTSVLNVAYDGSTMNALATVGSDQYNVMPVKAKSAWYCIVYKKAEVKVDKEQRSNVPNEGVIIQNRYDK